MLGRVGGEFGAVNENERGKVESIQRVERKKERGSTHDPILSAAIPLSKSSTVTTLFPVETPAVATSPSTL